MRVLLCGVPDILRDKLVRMLAFEHEVIAFEGDVRDLETCCAQSSCDIVIHGLPRDADDLVILDYASRGTWNLLTTTSARRYIFLSTMRMFDAYGPGWQISEEWAPRPSTEITQLAPYLAEVASREISRIRPGECVVLRLDEVVSARHFVDGPVQPTWLHADDALSAIVNAVTMGEREPGVGRWSAVHVVRGGEASRYPLGLLAERSPFAFSPHQTENAVPDPDLEVPVFPASPAPLTDIPIPERIVFFGAGGPLGAATTESLRDNHQLRLTDHRSRADIASLPPQSEGAPLPTPIDPPHEEFLVDVTDPAAVRDALQGMDTIINCTVLRHDPVQAFRVNTLGAFNVMQAAVAARIRRVVHTGPVLTLAPHPSGYTDDRDLGSDLPPRPGDNLYFVSKFLGQEICRIFAEEHRIACPTLLFSDFVNPEIAAQQMRPPAPFAISWEDSARAMVAATCVGSLPAPFVVIHVLADAPHDRYRNDTAKRILGWEPQDRLDHLWYRR